MVLMFYAIIPCLAYIYRFLFLGFLALPCIPTYFNVLMKMFYTCLYFCFLQLNLAYIQPLHNLLTFCLLIYIQKELSDTHLHLGCFFSSILIS